jgi:hypothetical protein
MVISICSVGDLACEMITQVLGRNRVGGAEVGEG